MNGGNNKPWQYQKPKIQQQQKKNGQRKPLLPVSSSSNSLFSNSLFTKAQQQLRIDDQPSTQNTQAQVKLTNDPTSYQFTGAFDDIDERSKNDPLSATDYVEDMYEYFRIKEGEAVVLPVYMDLTQSHINERMRSILVDWLVEVHMKFKLVPETLFLTVNLIDRYLERKEVTRSNLQLLGVSCLLIATKYEEIYPPSVSELVYICDNAYARQSVSQAYTLFLSDLL